MLRASRLMLAGACVVAIAPPTRNRVRSGIVRRNQRAVREFFFYRFTEFSRAKHAVPNHRITPVRDYSSLAI